ncbi:MAG TPA: zinc-binding dehydrogenase [Chloroflexota bacterium]|nr:zinc-binding dehydrogenase [Chloroflexota bacterium]
MRTGKSAVWHDEGKHWEIRELPVPETEPDGVSIRVQATSVCGSDLHLWRGDGVRAEDGPREPFVFGHEMMGVVEQLGSRIDTDSLRRPLKEGDRVAFAYFFPCMRCYNCIRGEMGACKFRGGRRPLSEWAVCNGGFAQYYYLRAPQFLFKLPDELDDAASAPINCALAQVMEGFHIARPRFGDNVVIQGAGGLGVNASAVARDMGANRVIVIDGQKARLELARQCGATDTIDMADYPTPQARIDRVRELTQGIGADIVIELVGFPSAVEEGVQMCRMRGTYIEVGHISPNSMATFDVQKLVTNQLRFFAVQHYDPWIIPNAIDFLMRTRDKYPLTKVISHQFPIDRIDEAFKTAEWLGRAGGSVVTRAVVTP